MCFGQLILPLCALIFTSKKWESQHQFYGKLCSSLIFLSCLVLTWTLIDRGCYCKLLNKIIITHLTEVRGQSESICVERLANTCHVSHGHCCHTHTELAQAPLTLQLRRELNSCEVSALTCSPYLGLSENLGLSMGCPLGPWLSSSPHS